jgi:hypothetical protein
LVEITEAQELDFVKNQPTHLEDDLSHRLPEQHRAANGQELVRDP